MKTIFLTGITCLSILMTACGGGSSSRSSGPGSSSSSSGGGSTPPFNVVLSDLDFGVEITEPLAVNHSIPISFTITGRSTNPLLSENIPVSFSFVEKNPVDPNAPRGCESNAINVEVLGNGEPQRVENVLIWPISECKILAEEGLEVLLDVAFYRGEEVLAGTVSTQLPELQLRNGGVDVSYDFIPESSVAVLPLQEDGDSVLPILSVNSRFLFNGADPYYSLVTPEEIPDELRLNEPGIDESLRFDFDDQTLEQLRQLPGTATLSYALIPASAPGASLPLMIGEEGGGTVASFTFDNIEPGTADGVAHDLYLEGENFAAVSSGGEFEQEREFTLRGCVTTSFAQDGNSETQSNDCYDVAVLMERQTSVQALASEITFNKTLRRSPGNKRIRVEALMKTENSLSRNGAFSSSEGKVELKGKLGKSFRLVIAQAVAEAELSPTRAFYDLELTAFDEVLLSRSEKEETVLEFEEKFSVEKSKRLGGLGFGFGPIRLGFTVSAGGRVAVEAFDELSLLADDLACQDLLGDENLFPTCAIMTRNVTPSFSMTGKVFGGLNLGFIKAGVNANLRLIETSYPLTNTLGFGLTDGASNNSRLFAAGNVNWDNELRLISGKVKLVGSIKIFRRRSKSVTIFSFSSKPISLNLLNRSVSTEELL